MIDIPPELPLPERCPCGAPWKRYVPVSGPLNAVLTCDDRHRHAYSLTDEQTMTMELAVRPHLLLQREMWVLGEDHPAPFGKLDPERCVVGEEIRVVDVGRYVVVDVEPERVWIQREMH